MLNFLVLITSFERKLKVLFKKIIHIFLFVFSTNQIKKFRNKYLFNNRNLEKSSSNKNLIITDIQGAIGDQIICLDLVSRIFKNAKSKDSFDILASKKFKNFINEHIDLWNLNFFYLNYSLGTHVNIRNEKVHFKNIMKIAKESEKFEYDKVFVLTRLVPIDIAIFISSIKCNKIYKLYDENNKSKNNAIFNESPYKKLSHDIFVRLKEKIEIKDVDSHLHFIPNSINAFNSIWKNEKLTYSKSYEFINIPHYINIKREKIKIFFCLNRSSTKVMNFNIIKKIFEIISQKYNVFLIIVTNKKTETEVEKIRKKIKDRIKNFEIHNKLKIEDLFKLMNESDFVLCHDSWDYHMANMLKKKNLLILNKNDWIVKNSFNYWLNYELNDNKVFFDSKYFNNDKKIFYSEKIVFEIFEKIEKILDTHNE